MAAFFANLRNTVLAGVVLAVLVIALFLAGGGLATTTVEQIGLGLVRWVHVLCGVMWIGLLWYFNFVSTPTMAQIPTELRPALGKYITPAALFWFRWAAMGTIVFGILLSGMKGHLAQAYTLDAYNPSGESFSDMSDVIIGIGMWLGTIMWFNVWFLIWPNQQKALNIANKYPHLAADDKAAAAKTAGLMSRVNTMLSIPMLLCMVGASHFFA
jgi:uncharacterized membrane protein